MASDHRLSFAVLGPLLVSRAGTPLTIRSGRQRALLGALLIRAGGTVSADELVDGLWGDRPPAAAHATLQTYVMRLRRSLADTTEPRLIRTEPGGYAIHPEPDRLDLTRFRRLRDDATTAAERGDLAEEARLLGAAQALWRGRLLADLPSLGAGHDLAAQLEEQWLALVERRYAAELELGRHAEIVGDLHALVADHPLRERLWAQLMRALHESGQHAQALDVYRRAGDALADELGVAPNTELRELHLAVLTATPEPGGPPPPGAPAWLPRANRDFTGRAAEIDLLRTGLRGGADTWVITGPGGVGKTSLAVHAAHLVRTRYPDGQLYLNLRGTESRPVDPGAALERMLRGLGVPGRAIPASPADRAEEFLSILADRNVLLVLDDAADERQVRPLLPRTTTSAALVTSRHPLAGLEQAKVIPLDLLSERDALQFIRDTVGARRVDGEPRAAAEIARYCGGLPLALRIATARLEWRPHWRLDRLAVRLADERRRLDELRVGDLDVRANLSYGYHRLDEPHRRGFRLLAMLDAPDFPAWVAAPLLGLDPDPAEDLVEALVDARLAVCVGRDTLGQVRYRLHDLLRTFGRELAAAEDIEPRSALRPVFELWQALAERADRGLAHLPLCRAPAGTPGPALAGELATLLLADPLAWFEAEWLSLRAAVEQSSALGLAEQTRGLAVASAAFCDLQARFADWEHVHRIALRHPETRADPVLLQQRGVLHCRRRRFAAAHADFTAANEGFAAGGDAGGAGYARHGIGWAHEWSGRQEQAREHHRAALEHFAAAGDRYGEVDVLCSLGAIERRAGRFAAAESYLSRADELARRLADDALLVATTLELGRLRHAAGYPERAVAYLEECLGTARLLGDPDMVTSVRLYLADSYLRIGGTDLAERHIRTALAAAERQDNALIHGWATRLLSRVPGAPGTALLLAERAVAIAEQLESPFEFARALRQFGNTLAAAGRAEAARHSLARAAELLTASGLHAEAGEARSELDACAAEQLRS
ncbi:AfsR/SARP family transcriptional regulator [Amycolatopsis cihanbeyliensis]|uniref:AfsR/SARP family transcriptional regulator n=1 Tax=Amycolatopsis cihanbeyliensis TaxID=1128664 RepID=UPI00147685D7|nr:AfsR/SARP family transcriptional regulator [Amycolatopsis cihanbeyliensis]